MRSARLACMVVARGGVARARITVGAFLQHHPGTSVVTLVVDGVDGDQELDGLGQVVIPSDVVSQDREWLDMAAIYDCDQLVAAAVPWLLTHMVSEGHSAVYLASDTYVVGDLSGVLDAAGDVGAALVPRVLAPVPDDGRRPSRGDLRAGGAFSDGLVGVSTLGFPFLQWWGARARRDAVVDVDEGLGGACRILDHAPALFDVAVLRDPGLDAGWWNLAERPLTRDLEGRPVAGGQPLRSLRLSGWDPGQPWRLTRDDDNRPRVLLSEQPVLRDLCAEYATAVAAAGPPPEGGYLYDSYPDGGDVTPLARSLYRRGLVAAEAAGDPLPPNPYLDPVAFRQWAFGYAPGVVFSRLDREIWLNRPDLQVLMSDPDGLSAQTFARWLAEDPAPREERRRAGVPADQAPRYDPDRRVRLDGWSVLAYAKAEFGVGEAGRRMAAAVAQVGCPYEVVGVVKTESRQKVPVETPVASQIHFANTITCVNADFMLGAWHYADMPRSHGRRIGLWFWEVDVFPARWRTILDHLDEVWVTSEHTKAAIDALGHETPVRVVPLPVLPPSRPTAYTRSQLGLPTDRTVFLCSYDFFSVVRRKNPLDVVEAYTRAFGPDDGAALVLKSINGHLRTSELEQVRYAVAGRPDIAVRDGYLDAPQMQAMIELSDAVVSLHRAEGYGLNLVDAMAVGTPVVATGYSGNLAFMDDSSSFLVGYDLVEVGPGNEPYAAEAHWAQPRVDEAAAVLRRVHDRPDEARARGARGRQSVLSRFSVETVGATVRPLLLGR